MKKFSENFKNLIANVPRRGFMYLTENRGGYLMERELGNISAINNRNIDYPQGGFIENYCLDR